MANEEQTTNLADTFITAPDLRKFLRISYKTEQALAVEDKSFPRSYRFSERGIRYRRDELMQWVEAQRSD